MEILVINIVESLKWDQNQIYMYKDKMIVKSCESDTYKND